MVPPPRQIAGPGNEADALAAARRGDLRAWEWLVRLHQELVFRAAYLATREPDLAEETAKGAFLRAYRSLASLESSSQLRPWLMRLTDTVARSRLREVTLRRDARVAEREPCRRVAARLVPLAPGSPLPSALERATLGDAVAGLMDQDRVVIAARYAFWFDRDEAATLLGVGPLDVDQRLVTSMARLRARVAETWARNATPMPDPGGGIGPVAQSRLASLGDDQLGSMTMASVFSELPWTPDLAPVVCARLGREAVAYDATAAIVPGGAGAVDAAAGPATTAVVSHRPAGRGLPPVRALGLLVGASLVMASFAFALGAGEQTPGSSTIVGSQLGGVVSESETDGSSAASASAASVAAQAGTLVLPAEPAVAPGVQARKGPNVSVIGARLQKGGSVEAVVRVDLPPAVDPGTLVRARLEQRAGKGAWKPVAWTDGTEPLLAAIEPGAPYRFRVRAVDDADAWSLSDISRVKLAVRGPGSARLVRSRGDWSTRPGPAGERLVAVDAGARVHTEFEGSEVALLGRLGPSRQAVGVRLDGGPWVRDPAGSGRAGASVLFSEAFDQGSHSLDVRALEDGLAVDVILILQSRTA